MKKTIIAAALAVSTLGFAGFAGAEYDLGAACKEAFDPASGIPEDAWGAACGCLVEKAEADPSIAANLEAANGDDSMRSDESNAAIQACFAAPAE